MTMRLRTLLLLASATASAGACTRTNVALMDQPIRLAPTCPEAVKLYTAPSAVGAPYQEVALLNSRAAADSRRRRA